MPALRGARYKRAHECLMHTSATYCAYMHLTKKCYYSLKYDEVPDSLTLDSINLSISGHKLIAIIGPVGSGKVSISMFFKLNLLNGN